MANDTVQTLIRDILREIGDPSGRGGSKELILRHITREAAYIASRYPNVIRSQGSPSSGPTNEVTLTDLLEEVSLDSGVRLKVDKVWINGTELVHVNMDELEGVID